MVMSSFKVAGVGISDNLQLTGLRFEGAAAVAVAIVIKLLGGRHCGVQDLGKLGMTSQESVNNK